MQPEKTLSCIPPFWAKNPHIQTILGSKLPIKRIKSYDKTFEISLDDPKERLHVAFLNGTKKTILYLFHGLGGSIDSPYMQRFANIGKKLDFKIMLVNHRGCGEGAGLVKSPYHSGRAEDLSKVIEYGKNLYPDHKHIAIGVSLSANALLLLAAKVRGHIQPDFAIAINAPINLTNSSYHLERGFNKVYNKHFTNELSKYLKDNSLEDSSKKFKTLYDFDEVYTAPLGGFKSREDYYETCSAKQYLKEINIPTLMITSKDDPFVSIEEYKSAIYSDKVILHIEDFGGHVGYITRHGLGYSYWLDTFLERQLINYAQ